MQRGAKCLGVPNDMFELGTFNNSEAMRVFSDLDGSDLTELFLSRGQACDNLELFSEWKAAQAHAVYSFVIKEKRGKRAPCAVLVLGNTGHAGVAQAALLARPHDKYRRVLGAFAAEARRQMPKVCAELGILRVEARCWRDHPTASRLLTLCGFRQEADLHGFGGRMDTAVFQQFGWVNPTRQEAQHVQR